MKLRFFRFLSLLLLSFVLITACSSKTNIAPPEPPPLKVAYHYWPGFYPITLAAEKGFFKQQGVKVELVVSPNYIAPLSDFSAGKYDGVTLSLGSAMNILEKNSDVQIIFVADQSAGADVVVAQQNIQSVVDLKGKQIGTKLGDFGELFVTTMLESQGLTPNDVKLVNVEGEAIHKQLQKGEIQAGHTWEPYVFQSIQSGAKVLFTSKQTPGLIPDVVVFRGNVVRNQPEQIKAFLRAVFQAQDYWKSHPEESKTLVAKALKLKVEEVSTDGIQLLDLKGNLKVFTPRETTESLYHTAKLYADFYTRTGGLSTVPDIQKLLNPSLLQQLK